MDNLLNALPGIRLPVESVTRTLSHMWDNQGQDSAGSPSEFRASQMNLILHFGLDTSADEALQRFDTAIHFAQRYPCRIIVLCPAQPGHTEDLLEAKLFSQCYIGKHLRDVCCCEALILGYSIDESSFLENQVSLWLESDLPVYHWFNRVPDQRIKDFYLPFINRCRRVLYDSAIENWKGDALTEIETFRVRDLAYARTLHLRQQLGQFISSVPVATLLKDLHQLRFAAGPDRLPEMRHLYRWHEVCLTKAVGAEDLDKVSDWMPAVDAIERLSGKAMRIEWLNRKGKAFIEWEYLPRQRSGRFRSTLPGAANENLHHIEPIKPHTALAEAMFF